MKLEDLTPKIVTPVIESVVEEYGEEYVYRPLECKYLTGGGKPSCIVGQVLTRLGVDVTGWDDLADSGYRIIVRGELGLEIGTSVPAVHEALNQAQAAQDGRESWGCALKRYKETLEVLTDR